MTDPQAPGERPGEPPEDASLPEHEQQAWADIVARLGPLGASGAGDGAPPDASVLPRLEFDPLAEEEGYLPPEPPPLPRPSDAWGKASWGAVVVGPVLVLVSAVLSWDRIMTVIGVAVTVGGLAGLVARMKDSRDDDGDGAVV